jgi:hypothetical protein
MRNLTYIDLRLTSDSESTYQNAVGTTQENYYYMNDDQGIPDCLAFCENYAPGYVAFEIFEDKCNCYSTIGPLASSVAGDVSLSYCAIGSPPVTTCVEFCGDLSQACDPSIAPLYGDGQCTTVNGVTVKIECERAWDGATVKFQSVSVTGPLNLETCLA